MSINFRCVHVRPDFSQASAKDCSTVRYNKQLHRHGEVESQPRLMSGDPFRE